MPAPCTVADTRTGPQACRWYCKDRAGKLGEGRCQPLIALCRHGAGRHFNGSAAGKPEFKDMRRAVCVVGLVAMLPVGATAAPREFYGKSVTVTWTETRSQRDAGEAAFRPVS